MTMLGVRGNRRIVVAGIICGVAIVAVVVGALLWIRALNSTGGGTTTNASQVALAKLPWCDQPSIQFADNSTTNQKVLSDWGQVRDQLNFTPYLPATMPKGSCLALAGGAIHDPIYGGRMSITYELPDGNPVSFSEAPKRGATGGALQCEAAPAPGGMPATATPAGGTPSGGKTTGGTPTATPAPQTTICIGSIANTTVTIAARQSQAEVQALFKSLQPNVDWVPQVAATATATGTGGATATATPSK